MMTAVSTAQQLDWRGWLLGIMGAIISGGAGAISSWAGVSYVDGQDPDHFINKGHHMLAVVGICFCVSAAISLAKFLQIHPIPAAIGPNLIAESPEAAK